MVRVWLLVALMGCKLHFDDHAPDGAVGADDDATAALMVHVTVTGHGAITGASIACATDCEYTSMAPVTVTPVAGIAWQFDHFDPPCGAQPTCTVDPGTAVHATFTPAPITANRVFVSSVMPTFGAGGRAALDTLCTTRATAGGLVGTFVAYVSTTIQDARDRLNGSRGWVRLDGLPLFDQRTDTNIAVRGVIFDELRGLHDDFAATGSTAVGTLQAGQACGDWTTTVGAAAGGYTDATSGYTVGTVMTSTSCTGLIYCFETGKNVPLSIAPVAFPVGRTIFVTPWNRAGGVLAGDAKCQADAMAAGLAGTYKVLVATTTETVSDRAGGLAGVWRRSDGMVVTYDGLDSPTWEANLGIKADRTPVGGYVSLGADSMTTLATLGTSCSNWSTTTGSESGIAAYRVRPYASVGTGQCTSGLGLAACGQIVQ